MSFCNYLKKKWHHSHTNRCHIIIFMHYFLVCVLTAKYHIYSESTCNLKNTKHTASVNLRSSWTKGACLPPIHSNLPLRYLVKWWCFLPSYFCSSSWIYSTSTIYLMIYLFFDILSVLLPHGFSNNILAHFLCHLELEYAINVPPVSIF